MIESWWTLFLFVLKEEVGGTTYRIGTPAQGVRGEGWLGKETDRYKGEKKSAHTKLQMYILFN